MAGNSNLNDSARNKQDEFYTQLSLIENELKHYKQHFKGKTVLCNCDDPFESNFFKFFAMNFNSLGLKKLISTCYASSPVAGKELEYYVESDGQLSFLPSPNAVPVNERHHPYRVEITEVKDENGDGRTDLADVEFLLKNKKNTMTLLDGDGDFRSPECINLLKQADIVCTNPPFSLFRDYMAQIVEYKKDFLIIGNLNAVKYKEILPLFMTDKVWLGYNSGHYWFKVPDSYEEKKTDFKIDESGQKWRRMGNICWYTNLDTEKRHEDMTLFRTYSPEKYPKYDSYDAIEVSKTADIPCDYYGTIGVPITFMTKHNPDQFEIIGVLNSGSANKYDFAKAILNGKQLYARILIRRKVGQHEN
ncbi:MAG: adenine-specific methyltransferase EcoRI family protein [Lactimicrobium massiliense]|nr:adenine-specific methyltransferase EcoRI family protein [Lactimicrobium massiliense]MDD6560930.1 adenine-specific methyltransferase EcoRI family protein [Lactimicrobium massiliense]